jgi:glucan-binding YG repeat protein/predicted MPP superfamily phosphohydrolase
MKKIFMLLPSIMVSALIFSSGASTTKAETTEQPNLQMSVISDTHINKNKQTASDNLRRALTDLKSAAPDYDTIAVVGDMTEGGFQEEYQAFNDILETYKNPNAEEVMVMGNHEWFEPTYDKTSHMTDEQLKNRFMSYEKAPSSTIYFDKWIKGYHFISLAGELSYQSLLPLAQTDPGVNDSAYISDQQYQWLEKKLGENTDSKRPIFVFLHQPIKNTVYGSMRWNAGFDDVKRLLPILKKYPQVILFSGHSHYLLNHPRSVYQDGFTMVNTSSTSYTWYEGGAVPTLSQGYVVNVYNDRVELKAREFSNGTWIRTTTIPIPFKETVKETNNPYFTGNSDVNVSDVNSTSASFSWNQGNDDTVIDRYVIKNSGQFLQNIYSHYWDPSQRESATINNLVPDTSYSLDIYATDAWDNISLKPIKVNFKTRTGGKGWYQNNSTWYYFSNNGTKYTGWLFYNNSWYYFDKSSGAMQTGWAFANGKWYFFTKDGQMKTGWITYNGKRYFLDNSGVMKTGWVKTGGKWYFFDNSGAMKTGWLYNLSKWYFFDNSGVMKSGWLQQGKLWYYFKPDGSMVTNTYTIDGKVNYFQANGVWKK